MTPSADSTAPALSAENLVPAKLLREGEVVILAIKPSGWSVVLACLPVLAVAVLVAAGSHLAGDLWSLPAARRALLLVCLGAVCLRGIQTSFQWLGTLYVLTNLRAMRIRGVLRGDVLDCPLKDVRKAALTATRTERMLALGSLSFDTSEDRTGEVCWININRPVEVQQIVNDAVQRTK